MFEKREEFEFSVLCCAVKYWLFVPTSISTVWPLNCIIIGSDDIISRGRNRETNANRVCWRMQK